MSGSGQERATAASPSGTGAVLEVRRLGYAYPGRSQPALADISFELSAGSLTLLAGPTGSGKSTLLRGIAGLLPRTGGVLQGEVVIDGWRMEAASPAERARRVGLVLQSPDDQICCTTVAAEAAFGLANLQLEPDQIASRVQRALEQVGLAERSQQATHCLSGGLKQRLVLASILAMEPRLILLDEPLSQLDAAAADELLSLLDALRRRGVAILIAEHRLDEVLPLADRLLTLDRGRLVADLPIADDGHWANALEASALTVPSLVALARQLGLPPCRDVPGLMASLHSKHDAEPSYPTLLSATAPPAEAESAAPAVQQWVVSLREVSFAYTRGSPPVLEGISLSLRAGERVALVGPNGSGKSTLLSLLAGQRRPSRGMLECAAAPVAMVLQNPDLGLICSTVAAELRLGPRLCGTGSTGQDGLIDEMARRLMLADHLAEPPHALSQGQRLRLAVAAALAVQPALLLLDEPTLGQEAACLMLSCLCGTEGLLPASATLLFATHDLEVAARFADRMLVLHQGRLVADCTPACLLDDAALLRALRLRVPGAWQVCRQLGLTPERAAGWLRAHTGYFFCREQALPSRREVCR
ncbi:MAG: ATP-binding cassette domain-containing protein [Pirellulales bacterium]|nr:ATP-binding cassette domain-containing protein [Pirellulales bacterium]